MNEQGMKVDVNVMWSGPKYFIAFCGYLLCDLGNVMGVVCTLVISKCNTETEINQQKYLSWELMMCRKEFVPIGFIFHVVLSIGSDDDG